MEIYMIMKFYFDIVRFKQQNTLCVPLLKIFEKLEQKVIELTSFTLFFNGNVIKT
jgi:hypothetical protein